ncbi:hypothetical protein EV667_0705 [Ancylobacter aquaticus]|uniref:Uncharacterized protein n=2 Tax=Ancylobacter aquaticus TaxID=100 RepID=A0A4R1I8T4_ANCAQ|nr:hypothetical protein EV667_0705 [Ancylobacter aquaticus]
MGKDGGGSVSPLAELFAARDVLNEHDLRVLKGVAAITGVDVAKLRADFERGGPLAIALGRLLGIGRLLSKRAPGRPRNSLKNAALAHNVVTELMENGASRAEAIRRAPAELSRLGVNNGRNPPGLYSTKQIMRLLDRYPEIWLDPPDQQGH